MLTGRRFHLLLGGERERALDVGEDSAKKEGSCVPFALCVQIKDKAKQDSHCHVYFNTFRILRIPGHQTYAN